MPNRRSEDRSASMRTSEPVVDNQPLDSRRPSGDADPCGCSFGCSGMQLPRREFLKVAGVGLAGAVMGGAPRVMAGMFSPEDLTHGQLIPADKKLDPTWISNLFARGVKESFSSEAALKTIGMPCGGIGAGQLYLCGDGTLGSWQIFNNATSNWVGGTGSTYSHKGIPKPVDQGFALVVQDYGTMPAIRNLDRTGFKKVTFTGEYPIATVRYADAESPAKVTMEAFSPFVPLNMQDSGLPATVFNITVENTSRRPLSVSLLGWLENASNAKALSYFHGVRTAAVRTAGERGHVRLSSEQRTQPAAVDAQPPTVFADFEDGRYEGWTIEGDAFGKTAFPAQLRHPAQQPFAGAEGDYFVNSFFKGDAPVGKLTSQPFAIERDFINLKVGGGTHTNETCVNLVVDGEQMRTVVGLGNEQLNWANWCVRDLRGKQAHIEIVDQRKGGWGHIMVDQIEFADEPHEGLLGALAEQRDFGTMALACFEPNKSATDASLFHPNGDHPRFVTSGIVEVPLTDRLAGLLRTADVTLGPGDVHTFTFVLAWHFPNAPEGQQYATRFKDATAVADHVLDQHTQLTNDTRRWRDTYYDSTLPFWLLDRLMASVSTLATGTCQWWGNGRFYAYEGVTCCGGTCTHVWNYAHTHARLFPELARNIRRMQDFELRANGGGFHSDTGLVGFRSNDAYAADGQCGTILKAYREHLMSPDDSFLTNLWPRIKKALEYSIAQDADADGLIENTQHNTYDINYEGPNTFVGALYLAALRAGEEMAREVGDDEFAERCRTIFESGRQRTQERLWDGEYFFQEVDLVKHPRHQYAGGCLSDQLFGQGWAHQVNLGYLYSPEMVRSALQAVWKYNWAPDVQPYNEAYKPLRWFITPGQAGLLICTWPKSDYLSDGSLYKNEVWTGIEFQVAGHMIAEDMLTEGLAICRAIHDRYHPELFNPYNEVECGDHYARAMAAWGVYLALAGYEYHGPRGYLGFAPRIAPEHFKAAFTAAEGWGTFEQTRETKTQTERITLRWGRLRLRTLAFVLPEPLQTVEARVAIGDKNIAADVALADKRVELTLQAEVLLAAEDTLEVQIIG